MDNKIIKRLLTIANIGLLAAGAVFLCISIFSDSKDTTCLSAALACTLLGNLFNLIRSHIDKKEK